MQQERSEPQTHETIVPGMDLNPVESLVTVFGLGLALPLVMILVALVAWSRARWRARAWRASQGEGEVLVEGDVVLQGTVEHAAGSSVAVRVEITQVGTEKIKKDEWRHRWKEVDRKVTANPFYIAEVRGKRVRVEPSEDLVLVDAMDQTTVLDHDRRVRAAELTAGEQVFAMGSLQRAHDPEAAQGYRGQSTPLVLRPPKKGRMMLASEPLQARFERTARFHIIWVIVWGIILLIFQLVAFRYHVRHWLGETVHAEVIHKEKYTSTSGQRGGATPHYVIKCQVGDRQYDEELQSGQYHAITVGDSVPVRRVPWWPSNQQVGATATVYFALGLVSVILLPLVLGFHLRIVYRRRPWWDHRLIDGGSGPLAEPNESGAPSGSA